MINVSVEVHEGAVPFRVAVRAQSITRAVSLIERRHPGSDVRVVFPINPEAFFLECPRESEAGRDESGRPLQAPAMRVYEQAAQSIRPDGGMIGWA